MQKSKSNLTIADIAKKAGVSTTTVSRVMTNSDRVKAVTKQKVQNVINELGYIPNHFAQCLAGVKSKQIGVVVDEIGNFFFTEILAAIQDYLNDEGYSIQIAYSKWCDESELAAVKNLISNNVDGIIIAPVSPSSSALKFLKNRDFPHVVINCILEDESTCVASDNYRGGKIVADFYNYNTAEQTFVIAGWHDQAIILRKKGFLDNIEQSDEVEIITGVLSDEQIRNTAKSLVEKHNIKNKTSNIFITNDFLAIPLSNYLIEMGVNIPGNVSIISYDNLFFSRYSRIPLSTIDYGINQLGVKASSQLLKIINGEKFTKGNILIEPKLVFRQSTKKE